MSHKLKILMAISLTLALAGNLSLRLLARPSPLGEERYLAYIFPEADGFGPKEGTPPHYIAYVPGPGGARQPAGAAFLTTDALPKEKGYAGPIHILVGLKNDGTITAIRVISHQETPSYAAAIDRPEYWERFAGKKPSDGFVPDQDVDGITRATITASAVARTVRDSSRLVARQVLGLDVPPPAGETVPPPWRRVALVSAALAGALLSFTVRKPALRTAVLMYSMSVLGFWLGTYLSLGQLTNLILGRAASMGAHLDWYLLLGLSVVLALLLGNLFCGWLCPFGALQEILGGLFGKLGLKNTPAKWTREASVLRWVYLWLTLMVALALGKTDAVNYEPFGVIFDWRGSVLHWLFLGSVLAGSLFVFRFWCRFFCPVGVIMQLLSSARLLKRNKFSLQRDVLGETEQGPNSGKLTWPQGPAGPAPGSSSPPDDRGST